MFGIDAGFWVAGGAVLLAVVLAVWTSRRGNSGGSGGSGKSGTRLR